MTQTDDISPPVEQPSPPAAPHDRVKRWLLLAAEIALVVAIGGLLLAIWLPALIGPHFGVGAVAFAGEPR